MRCDCGGGQDVSVHGEHHVTGGQDVVVYDGHVTVVDKTSPCVLGNSGLYDRQHVALTCNARTGEL